MKNINEVNTKEELKDYYRKVIEENGVKFHTSKINVERLDEFVEDLADATILDRAKRTTVCSEDMANVVDVLSDNAENQVAMMEGLTGNQASVTTLLKLSGQNSKILNTLCNILYGLGLLIIINILITLFK